VKILFDECVPRPLRRALSPHGCVTAQELGWTGISDGDLLANVRFDVFVTTDRNLAFQQNWNKLQVRVLILVAKTNRLEDLLPLAPEILKQVWLVQPGQVRHINSASA
jgi:hypothetical protein